MIDPAPDARSRPRYRGGVDWADPTQIVAAAQRRFESDSQLRMRAEMAERVFRRAVEQGSLRALTEHEINAARQAVVVALFLAEQQRRGELDVLQDV